MYIARDNLTIPLPVKFHMSKDGESTFIRIGQLNANNKLQGLGRKIEIHQPEYDTTTGSNVITAFNTVYVHEGQFVDDKRQNFARRIDTHGDYLVGIWKRECVHGYGYYQY